MTRSLFPLECSQFVLKVWAERYPIKAFSYYMCELSTFWRITFILTCAVLVGWVLECLISIVFLLDLGLWLSFNKEMCWNIQHLEIFNHRWTRKMHGLWHFKKELKTYFTLVWTCLLSILQEGMCNMWLNMLFG